MMSTVTLAPAPARPSEDESAGSAALLAEGLSYRRLDTWTRRGYLRAENPAPGSGHRRTWAAEECAVARAMLRLLEAGFTLQAAATLAREHLSSPEVCDVRVGPTLTLRLLPGLYGPLGPPR